MANQKCSGGRGYNLFQILNMYTHILVNCLLIKHRNNFSFIFLYKNEENIRVIMDHKLCSHSQLFKLRMNSDTKLQAVKHIG
jgi:hypothetical protein